MKFGTQQIFVVVIPYGIIWFNEGSSRVFGAGALPAVPEPIRTICTVVFALGFFRFFFWLAWTSDRGERFYRVMGLSKDKMLNGPWRKLWAWYCHFDAKGNGLDVIN